MGHPGKSCTAECWYIVEDSIRGVVRPVCEIPRELVVDVECEICECRPVWYPVHEKDEGIHRDPGEIHGDDSFWVADMPGAVVPGSVEYLINVSGSRANDTAATDVPLVPHADTREVGWGHLGDLVAVEVVDGAVYKNAHFRYRPGEEW